MKQRNLSQKVTILSIGMLAVILCGAIIFAALSESESMQTNAEMYADIWEQKEWELRESLCNLKEVEEAYISVSRDADGGADSIWAAIILSEEAFDSEKDKLSEIVMSYFEDVNENIVDITYIDFDSFDILNPDETTAF